MIRALPEMKTCRGTQNRRAALGGTGATGSRRSLLPPVSCGVRVLPLVLGGFPLRLSEPVSAGPCPRPSPVHHHVRRRAQSSCN